MKYGWVCRLLVALAAASGAAAQPANPDPAGPPLWVVRDGDRAAYLFGRMAVRDGTWLTPAVEKAFDASDELWLENPRADGQQANELIGRLGLAEGYSILQALDQTNRDRVLGLLQRAGMPATALDGRKAWLANLLVSQLLDRFNELDLSSFPDAVFRGRAESQGKAVFSEWRNIGELLEYSVALDEAIQLQMLGRAFDDAGSYGERLGAWLRGDLQALSVGIAATAVNYPDAHRVVNVERNARWVTRFQTMLSDDDTEFVAIGMGHLVGPDNLLQQLEAAGLQVERLN